VLTIYAWAYTKFGKQTSLVLLHLYTGDMDSMHSGTAKEATATSAERAKY